MSKVDDRKTGDIQIMDEIRVNMIGLVGKQKKKHVERKVHEKKN